MLRIDHILYGARDLEDAARRLREGFGLDSVAGGRHVGWGTENRIVPLGEGYVELVGIADREEAGGNPLGRRLIEQVAAGDRLIGWAVATEDIEAVASRLSLPIGEGGRRRPDGTTLRWRSVGLETAMAQEYLPFFLSWDIADDLHPGRTSAQHGVQPEGIAWVEVAGDESRLRRWLGSSAELPVRVANGFPGLLAVGIRTAAGEIVVR